MPCGTWLWVEKYPADGRTVEAGLPSIRAIRSYTVAAEELLGSRQPNGKTANCLDWLSGRK